MTMSGGRGLPPVHGSVADLGVSVASYPRYAQAQRAVDFLSDNKFPVEQTAIVGADLSLVEKVLGRMTVGRAAVAGAASGAWFGLFIGLMFALFSRRSWWEVMLTGLLVGAAWGAVFGAIAQAGTKGLRDFISRSSLAAGSYDIFVAPGHADAARTMLANLPTPG